MLEYFWHLGKLAMATGQFRTWLSYATVGITGASIHLATALFLVNHGLPLAGALPIAIQLALLNNFTWNRTFTFRTPPNSGTIAGESLLAGFVRYEIVCIPGALINSSATIVLIWFGYPTLISACAGVLLGGVWNVFFNVPAIWRSSLSRSLVNQFSRGPRVGAVKTS